MKVLLLGEYPPIASFTASHGYWLAQYLKEHDVGIYIVSDGWHIGKNFRCQIEADDFQYLNSINPRFFSIDPLQLGSFGTGDQPHHPRLVSLALDVYQRYGFDLIYTNLLPTYGAAAFTLKQIINIPLVISHHQSNLYNIINDPYLETFMKIILQAADLVLDYPDKFDYRRFLGLKNSQEMIPLGVISNHVEDWNADLPVITNDLPTLLLTGNIDYLQKIRNTLRILENIDCKFNLLLSCSGSGVVKIKSALVESDLCDNFYDLGVLAPWRQVNLYKKADLIIPTAVFGLTSIFDPGFIYQLMSIQKSCVLTSEYVNDSSYLTLDDTNLLIIDDDFAKKITSQLQSPDLFTKLGEKAKNDYQKVNQSKLFALMKGVI